MVVGVCLFAVEVGGLLDFLLVEGGVAFVFLVGGAFDFGCDEGGE